MPDRGRILIVLVVLAVLAGGGWLLYPILVISGGEGVPGVPDRPPTTTGPRAGTPATAPSAGPAKPYGPVTPVGPRPAVAPEPGPAASPPGRPEASAPDAAPTARATVSGRVVRPDGAPQPEASVTAGRIERRALGLLIRGPVEARARTDADGRFRLELDARAGEIELAVTHADYPALRHSGVKASGTDPVDVGEIRLQLGAGVRGQVRSVEAGPLAGVEVEVVDPVRPEVMGGRKAAAAVADGEGRFTFTKLAPGEVKVQASAKGYAPGHRIVRLEAGRDVTNVELVLRQGLEIRGTVVDERGVAVADASIMGVADSHVVETRSDARGSFVLTQLRPEVYRLLAEKPGHGIPEGDRSRWDFNAGSRDAKLCLERLAAVAGTVRDGVSGEPVAAFTVAWGPMADDLCETRAFQSADGSFELDSVRPGPVVMEVRSAAHAPRLLAPMVVRIGDRIANLEIVLSAGGSVTGRVVNRSDRSPLAGVTVAITRTQPQGASMVLGIGGSAGATPRRLRTVKTGADGRFRIEHLTGAYALRIRHPGFAPFDRDPVRFPSDAAADLGDLALGRGGTLTGRVPGKDGRGDGGAQVWVQGPHGFSRTVNTDQEGRFVLEHVPPGRYRTTVTRRGGTLALEDLIKMSREGPREVEVREGQVAVVQF